MSRAIRGTLWRPALGMAWRHHLPILLMGVAEVTNRTPPDARDSASDPHRNQTLVDVPPSIGPIVFGTLGVGWVMVRCPGEYDGLMRRAGASGNLVRGNGWSSAGGSAR